MIGIDLVILTYDDADKLRRFLKLLPPDLLHEHVQAWSVLQQIRSDVEAIDALRSIIGQAQDG